MNDTEKFLKLLDANANSWSFRVIHPTRKNPSNVVGSLQDKYSRLKAMNDILHGVFVVINDGGGKASEVTRIRALFVDFDDADDNHLDRLKVVPFAPSIIVESSPGKHHAYWLVDDCPVDQFQSAQKALITLLDSDKSIHDLSRVMRLPGFFHTKGKLFQSKLIHESGERYQWAVFSEWLEKIQQSTTAAPVVPDRYFERLCGDVAMAKVGERNNTLHLKAVAAYSGAKEGRSTASPDVIEQGLTEAALRAGMNPDEIRNTLDSAKRANVVSKAAPLAQVQQAKDVQSLFADLVLSKDDVEKMADAEFLIPNMIVRGHVGAYVSPGNGGKTTVFVHLCEKLAATGMQVLYINVDGSPGDLKRHYAHAAVHGYSVIAPDAKDGKSTVDVVEKLKAIAYSGQDCGDFVFIIDTLKKFVDVISKGEAKDFYKLLRTLTVKGATICLLGHCNKYKDSDGNYIYEGTADLRNDLDELIYLDGVKDEATNSLRITTRPDKVRAEFAPKSFVIHLDDDRRVSEPETVIRLDTPVQAELLPVLKLAIAEGNENQKDIVFFTKERTSYSEKMIRGVLGYFADNGELVKSKGSHARELVYLLGVSPKNEY